MSENSDHWHWEGRVFGLRWRLDIYRHHYGGSDHRWVIQPCVLWDR